GLVGKRSVPVVDVEDIIGCDVVGDVDIGPAVAVHVRHHHPESVSDLLQDPRLPGYIREGPIAVVAIELVVAFRAAALDAERVRVRHATGKAAARKATTSSIATDRKSTRLNSSHDQISYAVFCLKKKN